MERRKFIKACGLTVVGVGLGGGVLSSCSGVHYFTAQSNDNRLSIPLSEFVELKNGKEKRRKYILVNSDQLQFPICVYDVKEEGLVSSLMKCTHRGCELSVGGGIFTCPCHGAEFTNTGKVMSGPVDTDLKTFRTESDNENIYVYL